MNTMVYQQIFDILQDVLPNDWTKVIFYAGYTEGSFNMMYYTTNNNIEFTYCWDLPNVTEEQIDDAFWTIHNILKPVRKELPQEQLWSVMTMIIDNEGNMHTDFDYADITENRIEYKRKWKDKYIK